jgi:hypothetical protein
MHKYVRAKATRGAMKPYTFADFRGRRGEDLDLTIFVTLIVGFGRERIWRPSGLPPFLVVRLVSV